MARPKKQYISPEGALVQPVEFKVDTSERLRAALRPFAEHAAKLRKADPRAMGRKAVYEVGGHELTMADFDAVLDVMERKP